MEDFWKTVTDFWNTFTQNTGLNIVRTIALFLFGLVIIQTVQAITQRATLKSKLDKSASGFVISLVTVLLYIVLVIVLASSLGFSTAGIIAAFSAVALAVALALKDSLASLANGIIIIFTKPFKKGDYVEIGGLTGLVQDIRLFNTQILTYGNEVIIVPNSEVLGSKVINYTAMPLRRVLFDFNLPYDADVEEVKRIILPCISELPHAVKIPVPEVVLSEYGESALVFSARVWTPVEYYWNTYFGVREGILATLREHGYSIPFNHLDVKVCAEDSGQNAQEALCNLTNFEDGRKSK